MKHTIWLIDDHQLFRAGFKTLLHRLPEVVVDFEASNGVDFLNKLCESQPDLVFLDVAMPLMDGMEAATKALALYPELKIIVLSMYSDEVYSTRLAETGIKGYLLKSTDFKEVELAIEAVLGGELYFSQELMQQFLLHRNAARNSLTIDFTDRETEVLMEICNGLSSQEIAEKLFISKRTVEKHRANIMLKSGCANTASMVVYAIKHNILSI